MPANLSTSLTSALTGLDAAQQRLAVTTNNISNVNTPGFTRKTAIQSPRVLDGEGSGVLVESVRRQVDDYLIIQTRDELSVREYLNTKKNFFGQMQDFFAAPGSQATIAHSISKLSVDIETLSALPENAANQKILIESAKKLTEDFQQLSSRLQGLRQDAEDSLNQGLITVNEQLSLIHNLNQSIAQGLSQEQNVTDLQDQRDVALSKVSEYLDIRTFVRETGAYAVYTKNGIPLVDAKAETIYHSPVASVGFDQTYTATSPRSTDVGYTGIEGIFVGSSATAKDITTALQGGKLKGYIEMRDTIVPNLAHDLEKLAIHVKETINKAHNLGTAYSPNTSSTGSRYLDTAESVTLSATTRIALIDSQKQISATVDIAPGTYTLANLLTTINTGLPGVASFSADGQLVLNGGASGVAIIDASPQTMTYKGKDYEGFSYFFGLNDFFVDATSTSTASTVSGTMRVRDDIKNFPERMAIAKLTTTSTKLVQGDTSALTAMNDALNQNQIISDTYTFESKANPPTTRTLKGDMSNFEQPLARYASSMIGINATLASNNATQAEFREQFYQSLKYRSENVSGINLDEELASIIVLQQAYSASARIVSVANELLDILSNLGK